MKKYIELTMDSLKMRGYENENDKSRCLVMFHGFTGNKTETNRMFYHIDTALEQEGISTIRFDWFGHGESDLDFSLVTVSLLLKQAKCILDYAKDKYEKIYLLGFSMGGAIAINSLYVRPEKMILISPAINMSEIAKNNFTSCPPIDDYTVDLHGLKLSYTFVESFSYLEYMENIKGYSHPVLLIHGTNDLAVPITFSDLLKKEIKDLKYVKIKDADHCYSKVEYLEKIKKEVTKFLSK